MPDGTGILLQPAGIDVLRNLGLEESAFALGTPITRMVARERSGKQLMDLRYADLDPDLRALGIRRPALASLLLEAAQSAGVAVHFGVPLAGLREERGVSLIERDGSRVRGPFDLALVCDGTGSRLREHAVAGVKVRPHPRGVFLSGGPDARRAGRGHAAATRERDARWRRPAADRPRHRRSAAREFFLERAR